MDQHEAVVDHNSGECETAEQGHDAHLQVHYNVTEERSHQTKRDNGHHNKGLQVGPEWDGKHPIDGEKHKNSSAVETLHRLSLFPRLSFQGKSH